MIRQFAVLLLAGVIAAAVVVAVARFNAAALRFDYVLILAMIGTGALLALVVLP
jgi:hypothetical protein